MDEPVANNVDLPLETVREVLALCREHPDDEEALPSVNKLGTNLLRPELAKDVLLTAFAVSKPVIDNPAPSPAQQAHMVILLAWLLDVVVERDQVDKLLVNWLLHPVSFGAGRPTPNMLQREVFVQRVADLLGWGALDAARDKDALGRFFGWVNGWGPKNKMKVRRAIDAVRRNFPVIEVQKHIRF